METEKQKTEHQICDLISPF